MRVNVCVCIALALHLLVLQWVEASEDTLPGPLPRFLLVSRVCNSVISGVCVGMSHGACVCVSSPRR